MVSVFCCHLGRWDHVLLEEVQYDCINLLLLTIVEARRPFTAFEELCDEMHLWFYTSAIGHRLSTVDDQITIFGVNADCSFFY